MKPLWFNVPGFYNAHHCKHNINNILTRCVIFNVCPVVSALLWVHSLFASELCVFLNSARREGCIKACGILNITVVFCSIFLLWLIKSIKKNFFIFTEWARSTFRSTLAYSYSQPRSGLQRSSLGISFHNRTGTVTGNELERVINIQ